MDSALTLIAWVGLVLAGPLALLFWLVRRRRQRERALREAARDVAMAITVIAPAAPDRAALASAPERKSPTGEQAANGYSFPYGVPLVLYPILAVILSAVHRNTWLTALVVLLLLGLAAVFTQLAFSRAEFDKTRRNDPTMKRATWRINWLAFFALPPALLAMFGAAQLLRLATG